MASGLLRRFRPSETPRTGSGWACCRCPPVRMRHDGAPGGRASPPSGLGPRGAVAIWEGGFEGAWAILADPPQVRLRWCTTNNLVRLSREIRRREHGIRMVSHRAAEERMWGAVLMELHEGDPGGAPRKRRLPPLDGESRRDVFTSKPARRPALPLGGDSPRQRNGESWWSR